MKPSQIYWFIRRRVIKSQSAAPALPTSITCRDWVWPFAVNSLADDRAIAGVEFTFLNVTRSYPLAAIQWSPQDVNRLWRYNLHYFDFLLDTDRQQSEKNYLISDWITKNPLGSEPAWEPYTASLRIVNWIKYLSSQNVGKSVGVALATTTIATKVAPTISYKEILSSLYQQTLWLEQNLELHILANHYFENIKTLIFAGAFFHGDDAARWLTFAMREMQQQLKEQILPDGCHYERAPQYHCIILDDVLDLIQLAHLQPDLFPAEFSAQLSDVAKRMADFLADILNPLGQYPLFNDSAFYDVEPSDILRRVESLGISVGAASSPRHDEAAPTTGVPAQISRDSLIRPDGHLLPKGEGNIAAGRRFYNTSPRIIQRHAAGIYGYVAGRDWVVIDCGDIGPAYQPGHTHCDFLSYELGIDGVPVVVDTGMLEYEPGAMRQLVRSTSAHNVVQLGDAEQSEIWGEFRVARRARKLRADIRRSHEGIVFEGIFYGFHALGGVRHQRNLITAIDHSGQPEAWHITDILKGAGKHTVRSYIHLHPDINPVWEGENLALVYDGKSLARLIVSPTGSGKVVVTVEDCLHCPEFGLALKSKKIVLETQASLPAQVGYTIKRST